MAKRILLESYTFTPASRQVVINGRYLRREQLILITNVTTNTVIYNFADSSLTATAFTPTIIANNETTTIVLSYNTTSMGSTDKLSILVEETNETLQPSEVLQDPIGKLRVSLPQSLIDTDFEYGVQQTKWESLGLMNNRPSAYYDFTSAMSVTSIVTNGTRTITVNLANNSTQTFTSTTGSNTITASGANSVAIGMQLLTAAQGFTVGSVVTAIAGTSITLSTTCTLGASAAIMYFGYAVTTATPIFIQDTPYPIANGWILPITATIANGVTTAFTYYSRDPVNFIATSNNIFDPLKSYMFIGTFYTGAGIPMMTGGGTSTVGMTADSTNTVLCVTQLPHGLTAGSGIFIVNTASNMNVAAHVGSWVVKQVRSAFSFTFDIVGTAATATVSVPGNSLTVNYTSVNAANLSTVTVNAGGSGYNVGDIVGIGTGGLLKIQAVSTGGTVTQVGIYAVGSGFSASATNVATITTNGTSISSSVLYPRSWGSAVHRPFDGGVQFTAGLPYHGNQVIRQTRRYFRYQSGKGIQFNTGSNFCAPFQVESLTASGTTVTVTTKYPHNLGVGAVIKVAGADQTDYNGTFAVIGIDATNPDTKFTYTALQAPSASPATGGYSTPGLTGAYGLNITVQPYQWYGSSVRTGMFDSQNGFFFQYDGQTVYAVRRSSTTQISGVISFLGTGNQNVTGTGTRWNEQLNPGDFIVIRGMSYTVVSIESATAMTIYPDYRGTAITAPMTSVISKTIDLKIPQSSWNIDKCDGTGASGFNLDITKMQMWLMDYTWYGAGPIRWGFKNHRGEAMYAHRLAHGNNMPEAYMRSGNLPARYEVNTYWPITRLTATVLNTETTSISVLSTDGFPSAGYFAIQPYGTTPGTTPVEFIRYTGKTSTTFTGLTRAVTNMTGPGGMTGMGGIGTAQTYTYVGTANIPTATFAVSLFAPQCGSTISHWGSAVMMDGRFDDDKSFVFNYGTSTPVTYGAVAGVRYPVFSVRLAPTVDSGFTGVMGTREIINRMQLQPASCGVYVTGTGVKVEVWLNSRVTGGSFSPVGGSSLSQFSLHPTSTPWSSISGGECIYTFFAPSGSVSTQDLSKVRDIGNSVLGGGNALNVPNTTNNIYPDGPDILTFCVTPLTSVAPVVAARLCWTEAQA
jgi:hypothetical protein